MSDADAIMGKSICSGNDWAVGANIQGVFHPEKLRWGVGQWQQIWSLRGFR